MNRDEQIKLLAGATSRTDQYVADWMAHKDVKAALRFYHEMAREMKTPPQKACR